MKKLIFIRHGRAEDSSPETSDFERSLTLKGKIISKLIAQKVREKENSPGILITSPAFRALETAFIFAGEFGIDPEKIIINSKLYYKMNFHYLLEILSMVSEDCDSVTLFGHNPSFSEIANGLCREGCDFMPKSGVICISFNIRTWSEIRHNTGNVEYFLKPEKAL
ncbi:MAG: histidine phosphatase family protein [Bacteroidia bacterium]|nr:histidine phosphatase family protein [Bacteroidia bacterium]